MSALQVAQAAAHGMPDLRHVQRSPGRRGLTSLSDRAAGAEVGWSGRAPVRIAVDLLGGDDAPGVVVTGVRTALAADPELRIVLVGPPALTADAVPGAGDRVSALAAEHRIGMAAEAPLRAIRTRRQASVRVALEAVRDGVADGAVSAGPTGALVAGAVTVLGLLPHVRRPALAVLVPAAAHPVVLLDVGAGMTASEADLVRHARLGATHCTTVLGVAEPRVGLLSVGTEPGKGDSLRRKAHKALAASGLRYVGPVEGHHILLGGRADVVVTDGFTGNAVLKAVEGTVALVRSAVSEPVAGARRAAPLLGVRGVVVAGHGAAGPRDVADCVAVAAAAARGWRDGPGAGREGAGGTPSTVSAGPAGSAGSTGSAGSGVAALAPAARNGSSGGVAGAPADGVREARG